MACGTRIRSSMVAIAIGLTACGGGSSGSGNAPSVMVTPNPTPAPTPAPTSTPAPTPGPLAAGAVAGNSISGPYACAPATLGFAERPSAAPGLTSLTAFLDNGQVFDLFPMELPRIDTYEYGFVPTVFDAADKVASESGVYDQFVTDGELDIYRNQGPFRFDWATLGLVSNKGDSNLCALALGLAVFDAPVSGSRSYGGIADGIAFVGGEARRMFGSPATLTYNYAAGTGTVRLELSGRGDAFGNFAAGPGTPIVIVTGNISSANGRFSGILQSASTGLVGTLRGSLFGPQAKGAGVAFELSDGAGTRIIGSAAFAPS